MVRVSAMRPTSSPVNSRNFGSDVPTRAFVLHLNEQQPDDQKLLVEMGDGEAILDSTHLFIKSEMLEKVQDALDAYQEEITFKRHGSVKDGRDD